MQPMRVDAPSGLTLSAWLARARRRLADAGIDTARPDAERLAAHGLGVTWSDLWGRLRETQPEETVALLDAFVERRAAGEPLAYILGSAGFFGLDLVCGPGVLVPRPETETLVEVALAQLGSDPGVVVDLGTGTGAIALAVTANAPGAEAWATENATPALAYARENIRRAGLPVTLCAGDLFAPLPAALRGRVDLVASNPPYIPEADAGGLAPDVRAEPPEALFAGPSGDEVWRRIVDEAPSWLSLSGALVVEVGTPDQAERCRAALTGWGRSGIEPDRAGRPRVVWARRT